MIPIRQTWSQEEARDNVGERKEDNIPVSLEMKKKLRGEGGRDESEGFKCVSSVSHVEESTKDCVWTL